MSWLLVGVWDAGEDQGELLQMEPERPSGKRERDDVEAKGRKTNDETQ